MTAYVSYWKQ